MIKLRFASPEMLVDINDLPGLDYHESDADGTIRIGALCRHADLERSATLATSSPRWRRPPRWWPTPSCATGARWSDRYAMPTLRATGRR